MWRRGEEVFSTLCIVLVLFCCRCKRERILTPGPGASRPVRRASAARFAAARAPRVREVTKCSAGPAEQCPRNEMDAPSLGCPVSSGGSRSRAGAQDGALYWDGGPIPHICWGTARPPWTATKVRKPALDSLRVSNGRENRTERVCEPQAGGEEEEEARPTARSLDLSLDFGGEAPQPRPAPRLPPPLGRRRSRRPRDTTPLGYRPR